MKNNQKTTGRYSVKLYKCARCGLEQKHGTNHWGEIYPRCGGCSWKNPLAPQAAMVCLEQAPPGYGKPEPWKTFKLGSLCKVVKTSE